MSSLFITASISTLYVLNQTTSTLVQQVAVTDPVTSNLSNTLLRTSLAGYSVAPSGFVSFTFNNTLISTSSLVSATLTAHSGSTGTPVVTLSGQLNGLIWVTVTNVHLSQTLDGHVDIGIIVSHA